MEKSNNLIKQGPWTSKLSEVKKENRMDSSSEEEEVMLEQYTPDVATLFAPTPTDRRSLYHIVKVGFKRNYGGYRRLLQLKLKTLHTGLICQHKKGTYLYLKFKYPVTKKYVLKRVQGEHLHLGGPTAANALYEQLRDQHPNGRKYTMVVVPY